ncbi:MAG: CBS domain-containing protein [Deltaproteobacteria bacterium]|nr:CBS domain-containing protein [Deltaproteobacteria bacterium]
MGDVMVREVVTSLPDAPLDQLARTMLQEKIGAVPIVDAEGAPLGIVTKTDIVEAFARGRLTAERIADAFDVTRAPNPTAVFARDVMKPVISLREADAVEHAAELFVAKGVHRAPVIGPTGRIIGIVSAFDLLRAV